MPSLILDFQDIYRYVADDFVIEYARKINDRDFIPSIDDCAGKKCKREFLNARKRKEFLDSFDKYFEIRLDVPRIKRGKHQELETLISSARQPDDEVWQAAHF